MSEKKPIKPAKKPGSGNKAVWTVFLILLLSAAAATVWYFFFQPPEQTTQQTTQQSSAVKQASLGNSATASGTTARGSLSQWIGWSADDAELIVEKVMKSSGETVAVGDTLLQLTAESVTDVRTRLTESVADATTDLKQAEIDHQSALISAKADRAVSLAAGTSAKAVYNETLQSLSDGVTSAKDSLNEVKTIISTFPAKITALHKSIAATEKSLTSAQELLTQKQAAFQTTEAAWQKARRAADLASQAVSQSRYMLIWAEQYAAEHGGIPDEPPAAGSEEPTPGEADPAETGIDFGDFLNALRADLAEKQILAATTQDALNAAKVPYDQANAELDTVRSSISTIQLNLQSLNKDLTSDEKSLEQAQSTVATLQARADQAIADQKTKTVTAEETYQSSVLQGESAQAVYEIAVQKADQTLAAAKDLLDQRKTLLDLFDKTIGDGTIRSAYAGTLTSVGYEADDTLAATTPIAIFANASVMSVSASVDQADIASLSIGDAVTVSVSSGSVRAYQGKVSAIGMTAASTSVSSVKYTVTVTLEGNFASLASGQTVTVSFNKNART